MTSQKQISLFTEDELTSSLVAFHASRSALQASEKARKMLETSGRNIIEQSGRFNRLGSSGKMFLALLIGQTGWSLNRCRLIWKLKGTKSGRLYFQLAASAHPTEEKEFGLLPTPQAMDMMQNPPRQITKSGRIISNNGHNGSAPLKDLAMNGLLPTPRANKVNGCDLKSENLAKRNKGNLEEHVAKWVTGILPTPTVMDTNCGDLEKIDQRREKAKASSKNGNGFGVTIGELANRGMLPTPTNSMVTYQDFEQAKYHSSKRPEYSKILLQTPTADDNPAKNTGKRNQDGLQKRAFQQTGQTSQLNPRFVMEMMGFPPDWTELPFQSGETNQSKQQEMP